MNAAELLIKLSASFGATRRMRRKLNFADDSIERIWVHKPDHLGDAVLARPAFYMLRARWPFARICVGCHPPVASLFENEDFLFEPWDSPFLGGGGKLLDYYRNVRSFKPDLLVNLRHDYRDILFCSVFRVRYLASYDHRSCAAFTTHPGGAPCENIAEAQNHIALLQKTLGLESAPVPPLTISATLLEKALQAWNDVPGDGPRIVLHAAARTSAKLWPVAHWRKLIALLRDNFAARIALLGHFDDRQINREIASGIAFVADWSGRFALDATAAAIARADILVGIDSGPGHIAKAVSTPVVSIMSGTNIAARWAPDPAFALSHTVDCAPCRKKQCTVQGHPCLNAIAPEVVLQKVAEVLA